ncbi:MAG: Endo,3,4-beta-glycanase exsH [Phycisphaerales bacterium]|nr:Endo,3,4-beta-glycanase exsH [Phycisphaerales bacterium]
MTSPWRSAGARLKAVLGGTLAAADLQAAPPAASRPAKPAPPTIAGTWKLLWQDEFDGDSLDRIWHPCQYWDHDHTIVGHGELQAFDASAFAVAHSMLSITCREDAQYGHGTKYVSGLAMTGGERDAPHSPKFSFLHGYVEVRAKIPAGSGLWPAVWLMPASYHDSAGEIDVLEVLGETPTKAYYTTHRKGREQHDVTGVDLSLDFHTYGVDWQPTHLHWYLDGKRVATCADLSRVCEEAMYPVLSLAVGDGTVWGAAPNADTKFPAVMQLDYIRIWQTE